ncbi:MAG: UDP-N-acetylmuramoylalanine--D-glutamate ligase [Verrucomicrobiales bacterium]|jgi:UDP-N-acetylmuramoylalanine--D-glutamate ligase
MSTSQPKKIAVLGAGRSGLAAARLARKQGAEVVLLDSGPVDRFDDARQQLLKLEARGVFGPEAENFAETEAVELVVQSPGIDLRRPLVTQFSSRGIPVIGEIEFAWRSCDSEVIAITGTNGKTTTTEMIDEVFDHTKLRCTPAGNIGIPFSEVVIEGELYDVISLEVSSFQLEAIDSFRPRVSVWLNFAADHLDRYDSMDDYRAAKLRMFDFQAETDLAIVKFEDRQLLGDLKPRVVTFSAFETGADYGFDGQWILRGEDRVFDFSATQLRGAHNAENVMAALAAGAEFEISPETVQAALANYQPPEHRCELVRIVDGIEFINDSKATNLHAMESSLRGQPKPVVLIAGGKEKGLDFSEITPLISEKVSHAILIGETAERIAETWKDAANCVVAGELGKAVEEARALANSGQTVLFSPGSSSFDQFSSYGERGKVFKKFVMKF